MDLDNKSIQLLKNACDIMRDLIQECNNRNGLHVNSSFDTHMEFRAYDSNNRCVFQNIQIPIKVEPIMGGFKNVDTVDIGKIEVPFSSYRVVLKGNNDSHFEYSQKYKYIPDSGDITFYFSPGDIKYGIAHHLSL